MCTPLFVRVDFILMKKDRSRVLSGARRLGLLDSTEERKKKKKHGENNFTRVELRTKMEEKSCFTLFETRPSRNLKIKTCTLKNK